MRAIFAAIVVLLSLWAGYGVERGEATSLNYTNFDRGSMESPGSSQPLHTFECAICN